MSQRNFPPSFWNSDYVAPLPPPPPLANFAADPYAHMTSPLHSMTSLTQDPWRYPFSSAQHPHHHHGGYAHPTLHDFSSYAGSMAAGVSNRFNTQFSSFMPSAAAAAAAHHHHHAGKLTSLGQYDFAKHASDHPAWTQSRYHNDPFGAASTTSFQAAAAAASMTSHHQDPYAGLYSGSLAGSC